MNKICDRYANEHDSRRGIMNNKKSKRNRGVMNDKKLSACIHKNNEVLLLIKKKNIKKLQKIGEMFSTYNDVVEELLAHCDSCDRYWVDKL